MNKPTDNIWRYQAVHVSEPNKLGGIYRGLKICEVYIDKKGKLRMWTEAKMTFFGPIFMGVKMVVNGGQNLKFVYFYEILSI